MTGLCECGCDERTAIADKTDRLNGKVKGRPQRFVVGHNLRLVPKPRAAVPSWIIEDRGHTTPCWIWTGPVGPNGYGSIRQPVRQLAHRWSYEYHVGPVPDGLQLDHLCRVRLCVNPDHLEPVTNRENALRGAGTKLSAEDVQSIRGSTLSSGELALAYRVSRRHVNDIRSGARRAA